MAEISAEDSPAVQSVIKIKRQTLDELPHLQQVAARLYTKWIAGLIFN
jgi:hypothetical protein